MTQDTRKDKRAKVVSLNVRYKSATVDEFIENHSHDVSKGGIFVKTPTPFPPGTLLKFEIRLAGDKSVISGVGRVVWKREPTQAATEKPAGMGVKFIKIDDASRAVIDKLIAQKADAGSAYTSDPAGAEDERQTASSGATSATLVTAAPAPAPPASSPAPTTQPLPGGAPSAKVPAAPASQPKPAPSAASARPAASAGLNKTLPLGSVPPAGLGAALGSKAPGVTGAPAASTAPSASAAPAATSNAPASGAGGPPAPIKLRPATAIGVAPQANTPQATPAAVPAPTPSAPTVTAPAASVGPSAPPSSQGTAKPASSAAAPRPMPNPRKATMMGVAPAANSVAAAQAAAAAAAAAEGKNVSASGLVSDNDETQQFFQSSKAPPAETPKPAPATMADAFLGGLGSDKPGEKPAEKKPAAGPMFPISLNDEPVKEPTMMKQAAELLEEALREAGGSMEEIGNNPLFNQAARENPAPREPEKPAPTSRDQSGDTVVMSKASLSTPPPPVTQPVMSKPTPSTPPPSVQAPPRSHPPPASTVAARSVPPAQPIGASIREPEKKGSGGLVIGLVVVAFLVGGGVFAYKHFGAKGGGGEAPKPTASAPTSSAPVLATPDAGAPLAAADAAAPVAVPVDAGPTETTTPSDGAAATTATAKPTAAPVVTAKPKPKPKPKPTPTATATATATSTGETPSTETPPAATTTTTSEPAPAPSPTTAPAPAPEPTTTSTAPEL